MNMIKFSTLFAVAIVAVSPTAQGMDWIFGKSEQKTVTRKIADVVTNPRVIIPTTAALVTAGAGTVYMVRNRKKAQNPAPTAQDSVFSKITSRASEMVTAATERASKFGQAHPRIVETSKYVGAGASIISAGSTAYYYRDGLQRAVQAATQVLSEHKKEVGAGAATAIALGGVAVAKQKGLLSKKELTPKEKFMKLLTDMAKGAENKAAVEAILQSRKDDGLTSAVNNEFFPALEAYRAALKTQTENTANDKKAELAKAVEQAKTKLDTAIETVKIVVNFAPVF